MSAGGGEQERVVLAVDQGTGGPKVGFVSTTGRIVWARHTPVETRRTPDGGAVQDAEGWWSLIRHGAREALRSGAVDPASVIAVSVTSQWGSVVPVGEDGRPVDDCVLWLDTRGAGHARALIGGPLLGYHPRRVATWIRRTGGAPSPAGGDPISHMLFLQRDRPQVAAAARWFLEPADYLTMRFCGRAAASHASMIAAWLTDNRDLDRLAYDPGLVELAGVEPHRLAPLVRSVSVVGTVRDDVAADLGLPDGVPVVAGTPDLHGAAAGAGALDEFAAHLAISTTSWISCPVPFKKTDPMRSIASVPGVGPGRYLIADNQDSAGACLQWLRDRVLGGTYEELVALAAQAPPGSGGVIFAPWLAGERSPVSDRRARGGWHNVSVAATRAELARSVLEGVAYNARWLLGGVERLAGRRLDPLRLIGGGAVSDLWCQIVADVLDRRIERVADPALATLRGAALLGAIGVGALEPRAVAGLVPVDAVFEPQAATRDAYARLADELPRLYGAQKRIFARLNRG